VIVVPENHGVVTALPQAIEDAVEVVAGIAHRLQGQAEMPADRAHQLDIEAAGRSVFDEIERRIGIGGRDDQSPRMQRRAM